ncbi:MAG: SDR family oxidoreductase [Bacteroidota bacterium]
MAHSLENQKVLVTGGSSGIGFAIAELLKQRGAEVAINGRDLNKLDAASQTLKVHALQGDVGDEKDAVHIVAQAHEAMGGLDVLINNAGWGYIAPLLQMEADKFEAMWRTNVLGATLMAREAAKVFVEQGHGDIVNVASTSALRGSPNASGYNATKFALRGMTEAWRGELREHNIRVMLVNPSEVMTHFANNVQSPLERPDKKIYTEKEQQTKLRADEIAHTVVSMLEMDRRGFVTEATVFATNPQK